MKFLSIFILASSFVAIMHGYIYICNNNNKHQSCMLTMTADEDAFKKTVMSNLCPIDALTCDFGLSGFPNNAERLTQTTKNLKDMVNQTVMEKIVKELGLRYENPTNITLATVEDMDALTSKPKKNALIKLLSSIPGLRYLLSFLGKSV
uniref:Secreted protein n=1 Tax=Strongyloides venezuelensis TaxID=75913 RepID=A0A0K0FNT6_STRVS